jgi:hypothetical protein
MSFLSKVELKRQLQELGIKVEGNYVRKKDLEKAINRKNITSGVNFPIKGLNFTLMKEDGEYTIFVPLKKPMTSEKAIDFLNEHWETIWQGKYPNESWEYAICAEDQMAIHSNDLKTLKKLGAEVVEILKEHINKKELND